MGVSWLDGWMCSWQVVSGTGRTHLWPATAAALLVIDRRPRITGTNKDYIQLAGGVCGRQPLQSRCLSGPFRNTLAFAFRRSDRRPV